MKFKWLFVVLVLIVALLVIPVTFNYLFIWESGEAKGKTSDWFVFYGNIFGGLIGGFFTYLALLLTFKKQEEEKIKEKRPRMDIPHQTIEFSDSDEVQFSTIVIDLNNIGGSIAKNIECKLSISNFDEVIDALETSKGKLKISLLRPKTVHIDDVDQINEKAPKNVHLTILDEEGKQKTSLGSVYEEYSSEFVGTCIPLILNYKAKTQYVLEYNVGYWINYIVQNRYYTYSRFNKNELFDFLLEVKYSSIEYGEFTDVFKIEWEFVGIMAIDSEIKYQYVLKSTKVKS
jgi:hypothetical protein